MQFYIVIEITLKKKKFFSATTVTFCRTGFGAFPLIGYVLFNLSKL